MTDQPWTTPFEEALRAYLPLLPPGEPISPDLSLADHGLDSMATVSLILDLEEAFELTIPDHLLSESTFTTPAGIWSVIGSLLTAEGAE